MTELLQQLLEISATVYRDKVAVSDGKKTITYGELNQLSHQLAQTLKTVGVVKGDRLGIYLNKSLETVIAIFGILKAGGIYVPLDPSAPVKRIALLLEHCRIKVIISESKKFNPLQRIFDQTSPLKTVILTDSQISPSDANSVKLISFKEVLKATSTPVSLDLTPDELAYILYTSGSTGQPKGVMISHSAALNFINWSYECFNIQESDRLANHAPFHFDLSIFDLFTTIKAGATVILISGTLSVFPVNLAQFIAQQQITVWYSVPSILIQLTLYGNLVQNDFYHLKHILFAGEVFSLKYLRQLQNLLPHVKFHNLYGPTETNVCTYYPVTEIPTEEQNSLPIGKACANHEVFALNESGKIAAIDEIGELYVTGPSLMKGYWEQPEITQQVLVTPPNPPLGKGGSLPSFNKEGIFPPLNKGERSGGVKSANNYPVYRTGDLVKQKKDGNYLFLGRKDNIIKSRGYRIDLGEIEQTISNHAAMQEVVVIPIPHEEMGNLLKAIIVVAPKSEISAKDLDYYCSQWLAKYMIPKFEFVKSLPKTSTGKIDRALLKTILSVFPTQENQDKKSRWENNWLKEDFSPSWQISKNIPKEIKSAVEEKWFTQGTNILDIGCGSGEIAAYLAEKGFNVLGVDWAEGAIKKAKEKQGEIEGKLTFKTLDICQEKADFPEFQGLVDRGCFHTISLNLHQDYVNTVASYALPKAHFLLLCRICNPSDIPLPIHQLQQQEEQIKKYLQQLFQPKFAILKMEATLIERKNPDPDVPALAVYMSRL